MITRQPKCAWLCDLASVVAAGALAAVFATAAPRASAQAYGERTAVNVSDCDRDCLVGFAKRYMDGLVRHAPASVPFAKAARFTENDVELPIGAGLWGSISSASAHPLLAADPDTGNVAWFGTVEEHGAPAYYAMRLKVVDHRITEVETVVDRKTSWPAPFGDPAKLVHDPAFAQVLPPAQRRERERLRDVANGYFSTVERNDGAVLTLFDPDCQRTENGISTTRGSFGSAALAQGCEPQFKLGFFRINKRVRERRYPLIDVRRGVVVATGFFDHDNSFVDYRTTDGKERHTLLKWPNSLSLMEAFKIVNGRIYRVEAIFTYIPYFMHSPWVTDGVPSTDVSDAFEDRAAAVGTTAACDRACLLELAGRYMSALARHDPSSVPWAKVVRYAENGVPMQVGEGEWSTVTGVSKSPIVAADPATGSVAWLGVVEEHGDPAFYGMRLDERGGRIAAVDVTVDPARGGGPFGEAPLRLPATKFERPLRRGERSPRARLTALVHGYNTSHRPAGDRLRDGLTPIVDVERGVVVYTGFVDHSARGGGSARGTARDGRIAYPLTQDVIEAFRIRGGRIEQTAAISTFLPYGMPPPFAAPGSGCACAANGTQGAR
ncbi:MAG: hypothetical protein ACREUT_22350 [Steroidobacteraceae bacterium]